MTEEGALLRVEAVTEDTPSSNRKWVLPVAAAVLLGVVGIVSVAHTGQPNDAEFLELQGKSLTGPSYAATQSCYGYAGETCLLSNCTKGKNSQCVSRSCICEASCAGADGVCYAGKVNELVATEFTLANAYWPKYTMYFQKVSAFGQLKTTNAYSWMNMGRDKFNLYRMPAKRGEEHKFFLGSGSYVDKVARIGLTTGTSISTRGLYSTDVGAGKKPADLAVSVCYEKSKAAIMIGDAKGSWWAYVHRGSWLVYGSSAKQEKVGEGGMWKPDPPLTPEAIKMIPKCKKGTR